ncbi:hypothetical protein VPA32_orf133 [Klebsiella phage vB_KpnM_VPA32]|jgi:hypothetical protein|uniref:Uncharacterized protein n=2 Tax=Karamvirus TaxID=1913650 RepID=A0A1D3RKK6_9CAUD|nr:hypothetical protein KNT70_gp117 [Cronobacter phage Pet-CM3-4]QEG13173.1 hypothetical protein KAALPHA_136 [Klebsiella phage vB_KaeM_KaAlpha]UES35715.1 hypothetical protein KKP3262_000097 [Enterobacter phage KKP_3262]UKH49523.1 hypothetical protein [Enterobacter phage vB-EclM_KMB17]ULA52356.1 hypothetical protein [Enterobacter phage vB-EclM_KMB19]UVD32511.1 hypothetical protein ENTB43_073 [Enterobacter phage Entb_43]WJJ59098.1 hypothetical protein VPA32_orf133 [Klebsiella phage vB_KpnM_VPA3
MSIAVFVKSESADSYLYSFNDNESVDDIRNRLATDLEMFTPISDWMVEGSFDCDEDMIEEVESIMQRLREISWGEI